MKFPLGEMTVGDILDRGLRILLSRIITLFLIELIVSSPVILLQIAIPFLAPDDAGGAAPGRPDMGFAVATIGLGLFAILLALILQPIGAAAILHIIMQEYVGQKVTIGQAFSYAFSRFLPLLGASIVVGLLVFVGFLLCCIPGIYFAVTYAFVSQIVVLERLGVSESLERSSKLVKGYWWRVFGVLLLVQFASGMVNAVIGGALGVALPPQEFVPAENGFRVQFNPVNHIVTTLVSQLAGLLFAGFVAVCTTLLYLDLRIRKEGFDIELASGGGFDRPRDRDDDESEDDRDRYDDERDERDDLR